MFSSIINAFDFFKSSPIENGATRHINFSENTFQFSMPENFSRDMPAENLIEQVDLSKLSTGPSKNLLRRWWDLKENKLFGGSLGTLRMDINVVAVPENTQKLFHDRSYDITNRIDFILAANQRQMELYNIDYELSPELRTTPASIITYNGGKLGSYFWDKVLKNQKWTNYTVVGQFHHLMAFYVLPISKNSYLEVTFVYAYDNEDSAIEFTEEARKISDSILNSFYMNYSDGNPFKNIVENLWMEKTVLELFEPHKEEFVHKIYGMSIDEIEQKNDEAIKKLNESMQKEMDEMIANGWKPESEYLTPPQEEPNHSEKKQ